jgi:hypothetical protein
VPLLSWLCLRLFSAYDALHAHVCDGDAVPLLHLVSDLPETVFLGAGRNLPKLAASIEAARTANAMSDLFSSYPVRKRSPDNDRDAGVDNAALRPHSLAGLDPYRFERVTMLGNLAFPDKGSPVEVRQAAGKLIAFAILLPAIRRPQQ